MIKIQKIAFPKPEMKSENRRTVVAESEGFPSNSIFEELADWEAQLRAIETDSVLYEEDDGQTIVTPDLEGGPS